MSSTGVRAWSWTLQITDPSREVVAGEQVSLVPSDWSLVVWCYSLSPCGAVSPLPLLPDLSKLQNFAVLILPSMLGNPGCSSFTAPGNVALS